MTKLRVTWWSGEDMAEGREALRVDGVKRALIEQIDTGILRRYRLKIPGSTASWESSDPEPLRELGAVLCAPEGTPLYCCVDGRKVWMLSTIQPSEIECEPDEIPVVSVARDGLVRMESARDLRLIR